MCEFNALHGIVFKNSILTNGNFYLLTDIWFYDDWQIQIIWEQKKNNKNTEG